MILRRVGKVVLCWLAGGGLGHKKSQAVVREFTDRRGDPRKS